jgi:hypothetical protein
MSRHREKTDLVPDELDIPTQFPTKRNMYGVNCEVCGGLFYVDEATYNGIRTAIEFDQTDNPFRCDDCEAQDQDEAVL